MGIFRRFYEAALVCFLAAVSVCRIANAQSLVQRGTGLSPTTKLEKTLSAPVFIENLGQFNPKVNFQVKIGAQTVWLTAEGITFDATRTTLSEKVRDTSGASRDQLGLLFPPSDRANSQSPQSERLVFAENFIGAICCPKIEADRAQPGVYNYFEGPDPNKWVTNARGYAGVVYHEVWPGIDLRIYGNGPDLEQEFVAKPGADLKRINISYRGINKLTVAKDGSLHVDTLFGQLHETKPTIYQQIAGARVAVDGRFKLKGEKGYTFEVGTYRAEYDLVIDPTLLLYSTFLGGSSINTIYGMAVDNNGSTYVAGFTTSQDFPVTNGTLQSGLNLLVTKLNASGSALDYSSILGRGGFLTFSSRGGVALDKQGNVYVTGTGSNMPTTSNAYSSCSGNDGFLTVLAPAGNQLVYSTCLNSGAPIALAVDFGGRAFLAGQTGCGLATTSNAFQPNCPSGNSGFLRVLDPTLSGTESLVYSSYLGDPSQSLNTYIGGVALDSFGKAYITGQVYSDMYNSGDFPTTPGAFRTTLAACTPTPSGQNQSYCQWPYVAKFDTTGQGASSLIYSTYIGYVGQSTMTGDGIPFIIPLNMGIAVDGSGNAYITGGAGSTYPTTPGAYQTTGSGTFVTKLNASGSKLVYSTFLPTNTYPFGGGTPLYTTPFNFNPPTIEFPITLDALGQAYISGNTSATNYPVTPDAFQSSLADSTIQGGGGDAFLTILNSGGSGLVYSSYLGGGKAEQAIAVAVDQIGDVYVTGQTSSVNFPVAGAAFQSTLKGSDDLFVTKFPLAGVFRVLGLSVDRGGNFGPVTPSIFGSGFHIGFSASLIGPKIIQATQVTVGPLGRSMNATFDLTGVPPGVYTVSVTALDGSSQDLLNSFTVEQGGTSNVWLDVTGRSLMRGGVQQLYTISVGNSGTADRNSFRFWVSFPSFLTYKTLLGSSPSIVGTTGQTSYLAFDIPTVAAGATMPFVLGLTLPDAISYGHLTFQVQVWKDGQ